MRRRLPAALLGAGMAILLVAGPTLACGGLIGPYLCARVIEEKWAPARPASNPRQLILIIVGAPFTSYIANR